MFGFAGSIATSMAPVVLLGGARARRQSLPPLVSWNRPRWLEIGEIQPEAAAYTSLGFCGFTAMRPNAPLSGRPHCCQLCPPLVDL